MLSWSPWSKVGMDEDGVIISIKQGDGMASWIYGKHFEHSEMAVSILLVG